MNDPSRDIRQEAERLRSDRRAFVTATVVRAERPTSAKAGDSAIVLEDGTVLGFVGGACAHTSVQVQALSALAEGEARLLRITPEAEARGEQPQAAVAGSVTVHNPCLSGGELEIFLQPCVPPLLVAVHGDAPIARAVRELAAWLGFDTGPGDEALRGTPDAVVVASHGASETAVIEDALRAGVAYVGLIASPRRGRAVLSELAVDDEERARVRTPAGLDIGSRTPEEVALSVMAEIVSMRPRAERSATAAAAEQPEASADVPTALDPVCGMTVATVAGSRHLDHDGRRWWFCGPGCEEAFRAAPESFGRR